MIGISNFSQLRALGSVLFVGLTSFLHAADVTLTDDGRLTGEVLSMDSSGMLTLASPISAQPIKVKGGKVKSVKFAPPKDAAPAPDQRLELTNGDLLPVRVVSLENDIMVVTSETLGSVSIPRELIASLQLGIVPKKVVYRAIDEIGEWKSEGSGLQKWEMDRGKFTIDGRGTIARDLDLPEKFILRFTLQWSQHPNFRMFFADPLTGTRKRADRYYLQYAGAGLEVRRESTGEPRDTPLVLLNRTPDRFPDSRITIELRVDRLRGTIHIYLDGVLEGRYADPIPNIPVGSGVSMLSLVPNDNQQTISNLEVLVWDDRGDRHRTEDRGDLSMDSLIGRHGERFGGTLSAILPGEDGAVFEFKSDFKKDPILLPEQEVSTVFLSGKKSDRSQKGYEGLILRLRGGGEMRVSSCEFGEKSVQAIHPLLGKIVVARAGITGLERRTIPKAKPVKSR